MSDAPERIWANPTERDPLPVKDGKKGKWRRGKWKDHDSFACGAVEYIRADIANARVAAAYEAAAKECQEWGNGRIAQAVLALTPEDAKAALEALQAENEKLREALQWLDNVVERNCTPTGKPARIRDEVGEWHSGPSADICHKVLRGLQRVARAALKGDDNE